MEYLKSTNDYTDRTNEILTSLKENGCCFLGNGIFVVKNLDMPVGSMLSGCGNSTVLMFDTKADEGYAVKLNTFCSVKNMQISGSETDIELKEELGKRHGIMWSGNFSTDKGDYTERGTVNNLYIHGFSGGGITENNTGYATTAGLNVSDCYIWNCCAGVNIIYWSEFNRYTNVCSTHNYYGCINNGGNNVFVNCGFSKNVVGIYMYNIDHCSPNNSHGNFVGCTIDHSDNNNGFGIKLINMKNSHAFTSCQCFFSSIYIEDCDGILFSDFCSRGEEDRIVVKGGGAVSFNNCVWCNAPKIEIENNDSVYFNGCCLANGESFGK